ncbi:unnamed protein product [Camellia sinensis]
MFHILNEVRLCNTRGSSTWALNFANLIIARIKGQGTYPLEPNEVQFPLPTLYGKTHWRQTTARLPPPLLFPDALANPNDVSVELAAAPAPTPLPFRMARAQYRALLDNQAAIQQSMVDLRVDYQAYWDHSHMAFDGYQQSGVSLQTNFYAYWESTQQRFDQLVARVHNEALETQMLMHALFKQHFPPPPNPLQ